MSADFLTRTTFRGTTTPSTGVVIQEWEDLETVRIRPSEPVTWTDSKLPRVLEMLIIEHADPQLTIQENPPIAGKEQGQGGEVHDGR